MESLPLDILNPSTPPWQLPHPYTTTLTAPWSGAKPPLFETIAEALVQGVDGTELLGELNPCPEGVLWAIVADCPGVGRVIAFAQHSPAEQTDSPSGWEVGIELLLDPEQPIARFTSAMRLLDLLVPDASSILDAVTRFRWDRIGLERHFLGPAPDPPDHVIWAAHASTRSRTPGAEDSTWLRTSGLWRCGRPELEMLDVPFKHVNAGVALLQGMAGLMLEVMPPAPGLAWRLGQDVTVALRSWDEVAPLLADELPGSMALRRIPREAIHTAVDHPFGGVRGVVCAPTPRGTSRQRKWVYPEEVLERIEAGTAAIDQSGHATARTARIAQRTLPTFAEAVHLLAQRQIALEGPGAPILLVKTPFAVDDGTEGHEHVWIRVLACEGETIGGRVLQSSSKNRAVSTGELIEIPSTRISDWHARVGSNLITPDEADRLLESIRKVSAS